MRPVRVDWTFATEAAVGERSGISERHLDELSQRAREVHADLVKAREAGALGFWDLKAREADARAVAAEAMRLREEAEWLIVLGIGGSALGTRTLLDAFVPPAPYAARPGPKVVVLDNVDPERLARLAETVDWRRAAINVVSKSGSTTETGAQFVWLRDLLVRAVGAETARRRIVVTTDGKAGVLRPLVTREGHPSFEVPDNVGGRFSVLTPVGLLPAAVAGIDVRELVAGAAEMAADCDSPDLRANPGALLAALHWLGCTRKGHAVSVMMSYADGLLTFAEWYKQLWAESLGKRRDRAGREVFAGQTPVTALGPTDQHSILQLLMEGPFDKLVTFLGVDHFRADPAIPSGEPAEPYPYLAGRRFAELVNFERDAVAAALAAEGRPSVSVLLDRLTPRSMGQLFFLYQAATAFAGGLFEVDPFDQPGVEAGKRITYALLGRKGFEAEREAYERLRGKTPPRVA